MKKLIKMLLAFAAAAMIAVLPCAQAEYEGEILFRGHRFGETFAQSIRTFHFDWIEMHFQPMTTRAIAEPTYQDIKSILSKQYEDALYGFTARSNSASPVAGHTVFEHRLYYFPTVEAAKGYDLGSAVFYAGIYSFADSEDQIALFNELKAKLISLYGLPDKDATTPLDIWEKPAFQAYITEAEAMKMYRDYIQYRSPMQIVVWESAASEAQILLVNWDNDGTRSITEIYYVDPTADVILENLYGAMAP